MTFTLPAGGWVAGFGIEAGDRTMLTADR